MSESTRTPTRTEYMVHGANERDTKLMHSSTRESQTADSALVVATWEVTLSARKVVPCVSWLATGVLRTIYSQAQSCVCTALQLGGDVEQPWLMSKYDVIHKTEVHNISLRGQKRTEPRP